MDGKLLYFYQPANLNLPSNREWMKMAVKADMAQQQAFLSKEIPGDVFIHWLKPGEAFPEADVYFDLSDELQQSFFVPATGKPFFVNAVISTSAELPDNAIRINAWNGFLEGSTLEIYGNATSLANTAEILNTLHWAYQVVPDIPGMIAPRVVAMIINEAYFGLGEEISSKKDIDTAMKLGTNYPYGPFEWSEKIGLKKIYALLQKLGEKESRYAIAPKLIEDLNQNKPVNK